MPILKVDASAGNALAGFVVMIIPLVFHFFYCGHESSSRRFTYVLVAAACRMSSVRHHNRSARLEETDVNVGCYRQIDYVTTSTENFDRN